MYDRTPLRLSLWFATLSLLFTVSHAVASMPFAHVGTLEAFDNATRELRLVGADEKPMVLKLDGMVLREGEGAIREANPDVTPFIGRRIGFVLRDDKTIHLLVIARVAEDPPLKGQVSSVDDVLEKVWILSEGTSSFFRPTVNMAARSVAGGSLESGSWDWFEGMITKNVKLTTVRINGQELIWSVEPWDPKTDPIAADE